MSKKKILLALSIFFVLIIIFVLPSKENIPCLLLHHVRANTRVSPEAFEQMLNWLNKEGYESIFVSDLLKYKNKKSELPSKTIVISFDDGYEDNFLYAFPLLKKYGFKATIFIITSKITTTPGNGWLSWKQLEEMVQSGYVEIQSHSVTHSYCYTSNKITTFNSPFFWHIIYAPDNDRRFGIPIYERKPSLTLKCYCDDHNLRNYLAEYIAQQGNEKFFNKNHEGWEKRLFKLTTDYISQNGLKGYFENGSDYLKRVTNELLHSKDLIANKLTVSCLAIAWPWGQYTDQLISTAASVGYRICVTADRGTNYIGEIDLKKIKRIEGVEYGLNKIFLGHLPLWVSIKIRLFIYRHFLLGNLYILLGEM